MEPKGHSWQVEALLVLVYLIPILIAVIIALRDNHNKNIEISKNRAKENSVGESAIKRIEEAIAENKKEMNTQSILIKSLDEKIELIKRFVFRDHGNNF